MAQTQEQAARVVKKWRANPEAGASSTIGARMLRGTWVVAAEVAEELGCAPSVANQVRATLEAAGYAIEREQIGGTNGYRYRVPKGGGPRRPRAVERAVAHEEAGHTHPQLGAVLTVRALVMDERGRLVMQLSNGHASWAAEVVGHTEAQP